MHPGDNEVFKSLFGTFADQLKLVDDSFAQIKAKYERLVQADLCHQELCNLRASYSHYPDMEKYFLSLMEFAPTNVLELSLQRQFNSLDCKLPYIFCCRWCS